MYIQWFYKDYIKFSYFNKLYISYFNNKKPWEIAKIIS